MHSVWDDRNTELNPIGTTGNKNSVMVDDDTSVSATNPMYGGVATFKSTEVI